MPLAGRIGRGGTRAVERLEISVLTLSDVGDVSRSVSSRRLWLTAASRCEVVCELDDVTYVLTGVGGSSRFTNNRSTSILPDLPSLVPCAAIAVRLTVFVVVGDRK